MFPLKDDVPSRSTPVVTIGLIVMNALVFFYELSQQHRLDVFIDAWALTPSELVEHPVRGAVPLFTSMFLHGGWMHLLGNMLYLWIFGDNVEDRMGRARFLVFYVLCGVAAALAHVALSPRSEVPTLGASGAIAGVLGGYILLYPRARVLAIIPIFIFIRMMYVPAVLFLAFWFVLQLFNGAATLGSDGPGVAYWAHAGGFVAGFVLVKLFVKREDPRVPGRTREVALMREPELRRFV
jgi:membrane associated rhomboid family serine protease